MKNGARSQVLALGLVIFNTFRPTSMMNNSLRTLDMFRIYLSCNVNSFFVDSRLGSIKGESETFSVVTTFRYNTY